jgi:hypothetical protein
VLPTGAVGGQRACFPVAAAVKVEPPVTLVHIAIRRTTSLRKTVEMLPSPLQLVVPPPPRLQQLVVQPRKKTVVLFQESPGARKIAVRNEDSTCPDLLIQMKDLM